MVDEPTDQAHDGEAGHRQAQARPTTQARRRRRRPSKEKRIGPREYLGEVRASCARSPGPPSKEVINSTIIVLIAVVVMTTLIFGFDYASAKFVLFLFD